MRTIEKAFGLPGLNKFDKYANTMKEVFQTGPAIVPTSDLTPDLSIATRGSSVDTFGRTGTTASVQKGNDIKLIGPATTTSDSAVSIVPIDQVPTSSTSNYIFDLATKTVSIPSKQLNPGIYGAWLQHGTKAPYRSPITITVLPKFSITPSAPGVEIVGSNVGSAGKLDVREGSNLIVHYCLPAGTTNASGWIGIFAQGTPANQMTKDNANLLSIWLKTPGYAAGQSCGEAPAFTSELPANTSYKILMFVNDKKGNPKQVGSTATINIIPSLPAH